MNFRSAISWVAKGVLVSAALTVLAGCGLKGKPVPMEQVVPRVPSELRLEVFPEGIRVSCQVPQRNSDGSPLTDLDAVVVERATGMPVDCPTCPPAFSKLGEVTYLYPEGAEMARGTVEYLDRLTKPGLYHYRVVARTGSGLIGKVSAKAEAYWDLPPRAVEGIEVRSGDKQVEVRWDPVRERSDGSGVDREQLGYQVFRSRKDGGFGPAPLNASPLREPQFLDTAVQNDVAYEYRVRAVLVAKGRPVPGPFSASAEALPQRLFPPAPPEGVIGFATASAVRVVWERGDKPDITGFRVYRADGPDGPWEILTKQPITMGFFDDASAVRGRTYWYSVTALDDAQPPRESERSNWVRVHVPRIAVPAGAGGKSGQ